MVSRFISALIRSYYLFLKYCANRTVVATRIFLLYATRQAVGDECTI